MQQDRIARMYQQMFEDLEKLSGKWMTDFQEEMSKWTQDLLKDAFDPAKMLRFIRGMGVDIGQFSQMFSGMASSGTMPQGFDPYVILHLDKSASNEEVKQVYRKVMSKIHPDKAGPELTTVAALVNAAYELIKKERGWQ
ncbi:Co-chaperone protein DjlA [subsurface metagenome]